MPVNSVITHPEENTIVKPGQVLEVSGIQTRQFEMARAKRIKMHRE
jgi:hypothetical protein